MTDALLELAHREYTIGDYKNAEAHCKQVKFPTDDFDVISAPIPRQISFCVKGGSESFTDFLYRILEFICGIYRFSLVCSWLQTIISHNSL